jgi:hypothetical protein
MKLRLSCIWLSRQQGKRSESNRLREQRGTHKIFGFSSSLSDALHSCPFPSCLQHRLLGLPHCLLLGFHFLLVATALIMTSFSPPGAMPGCGGIADCYRKGGNTYYDSNRLSLCIGSARNRPSLCIGKGAVEQRASGAVSTQCTDSKEVG